MRADNIAIEPMPELKEEYENFISNIHFLNGVPIKDQVGITDEEILQLHATACYFFEKGKLNEAEMFFRQLCIIDGTNLDFSLGLGAVLQRKKLYGKAVDIYALAHMIQTNDSRPMFYAGQCHFFDRKHTKAKMCFEIVVRDNFSPELTKMAQLFLEAIERGKSDD